MPPKKAEGKKKKKSARPPWMSEELYDLSQNLSKLQEFWSGEMKEAKKSSKDSKPKEIPNITRTQAGLFMWQLLFPNNKAAKEKREETIKLGVTETCCKILASGKPQDMTPAIGILATLVESMDNLRQVMMDNKPSPIPHLLNALKDESASLRATTCSLLRVLSSKPDTRPRLWRQLRDWDWTPLLGCLGLQEMSQLGGRNAAHDAMLTLDALCNAPESDIANGACNAIINIGGLTLIVHVLQDRISHPMARAAGLSVLNHIMRRSPASLCEDVVVRGGGLKPIVNMFDHPVVPLMNKAHAAACLLRFILPDSLWRDSSILSGHGVGHAAARPRTAPLPAPRTLNNNALGAGAATATATTNLPSAAPPLPSIADMSAAPPTSKADELRQAVNYGLETGGAGGQGAGASMAQVPEPAVPDDHLLDDDIKTEVLRRARMVAEAGALKALVLLCVGPEGPLPDLEAKAAAAAAAAAAGGDAAATDAKKKKKKPAKKKKKKGKLEAGMAEAQTFGSAVVRLISLAEDWRAPVVAVGAVRYLLPLLESKIHPARWNARQTLINLSMTPDIMPTLQLYKVPEYIHGANIPVTHFDRPFPPSGLDDGLERVPAHLANAANGVRGTESKKPPALKNIKIDGAVVSRTAMAPVPTPTRMAAGDTLPRPTTPLGEPAAAPSMVVA